MKTLSYKLILAILIFSICATGANKTQASQSIADESCDEYVKVDAELNQVYKQILSEYSADKQFIIKLKQAQRAWLAFTAAHLAALYPDPKAGAYGSVNRTCLCIVKTDLTRERIAQLREWLKGTEEGDVCAGSIRRRE